MVHLLTLLISLGTTKILTPQDQTLEVLSTEGIDQVGAHKPGHKTNSQYRVARLAARPGFQNFRQPSGVGLKSSKFSAASASPDLGMSHLQQSG